MPSQRDEADEEVAGELKVADYIGHKVKETRLQFGLTLAELADTAGISRGMLSKIENGQTMPGLDTLFRISNALGVSMSSLFQTLDERERGAQHVKRGTAPEVLRVGSKHGHHYHLLASNPEAKKDFESFLIEIGKDGEAYPHFEHPGTETIHMLEGSMEFRYGRATYVLEPGDTLTFASHIPHGPERLIKTPVRCHCVMIHPE